MKSYICNIDKSITFYAEACHVNTSTLMIMSVESVQLANVIAPA